MLRGDFTHSLIAAYRPDPPARRYTCAHCGAAKTDRVGMCLNCGSRQVKECP